MSLKKTAEDLLKIADQIETEASEVTQFVCDKCNHTATLATINASRKTAAEGIEDVTVSEITVNDKISCPACEGVMAYSETDESKAYYFDPDAKVEAKADPDAPHSEKTETPEQEKAESLETQERERAKGKHASIDYDALDRYMKG
jgi:hypothetical protein